MNNTPEDMTAERKLMASDSLKPFPSQMRPRPTDNHPPTTTSSSTSSRPNLIIVVE